MIERVVTPVPRREWAAIVADDAHAMADHTPEWTAAASAWGWSDASRLYRLVDGRAVVLPLLRAGGRARSTVWAASPPAGRGFGGLVGKAGREPAVVEAVLSDLAAERWLSVRIRPDPLTADLWSKAAPPGAQTVARRAHVLDLAPGPDALLAAMRKSTRRCIRRHQRDGLDVEVGDGDTLLGVYEELWRLSVDRWAADQREPLRLARWRAERRDPPERLRATARALGSRFGVWVARLDGRPVAANVVVSGNTAHATRAAMDRDRVGSSGIMQYLDWLAIEQACTDGCRALNLGESGSSDSLSMYKEGLGAVAHDYSEVRLERVPITAADGAARTLVKRAIGFRELGPGRGPGGQGRAGGSGGINDRGSRSPAPQ